MEEWKEYKLGEITVMKNGKKRPQKEGLYPVYGGNGVMDYANDFNSEMVVIVGRVGAYCGCVYKCDEKCWVSDNAISVSPKDNVDFHFLYYLMSTLDFHHHHIGGAQPLMTQDIIGDFKIKLPSIKDQQQIVAILKSLDDKIEVNRRINDNLEEQAQTLFKSWFVDFEPFKDGEFVESELGMIPKGWRVGKLGELCHFKRGKNLLSRDSQLGDVPVVAGGLEPACYHNMSNTKSPVVTVSGSGANAGFMRMYYQEVWASDCSFIDSTCDNLFFVYYFLAINRRLLKHAQVGAVQPHVKPADIHDFDIIIPSYDKIKEFQALVSPTIDKKGKIVKESKNLAAVRDTLLPRLMSGEL